MLAVVTLGVFFTVFSTIILSYLSIATMVGPWLAPTIVLLTNFMLSALRKNKDHSQKQSNMALIQGIGAGGGIIATGVGFAFPMLFFLDPETFASWLASPLFFCSTLTALTFTAGILGIFLGKYFAKSFFSQTKLAFPVSQLTYKTITAQDQPAQGKLLMQGSIISIIVSMAKDGIGSLKGFLPASIPLLPSAWGFPLAIPLWPSIWAIGFVIGASCIIPLFVGIFTKQTLITLLKHAPFMAQFSQESFTIAFCSGMLAVELVLHNIKNPITMAKNIAGKINTLQLNLVSWLTNIMHLHTTSQRTRLQTMRHAGEHLIAPACALLPASLFLSYFDFSLPAQIMLFILITWATYHISLLGASIGLVQFGRFSTFVVIPMLIVFKLNFVQMSIVCVFFNVCAAVASDLLFDYKTADLCDTDRRKMLLAQWIGLMVTALCIGAILWLLFTHLTLGSPQLFAQRGKAKALLLQALNFDLRVVCMGLMYGFLLKKLRINGTMAFSGMIMPYEISLGLIAGSWLSKLAGKNDYYLPFCSGVFATESLWILARILVFLPFC